ncbi:hypothetical protein HAX54_007205 [Datura stramonium]|uniref:Uncharacterized protein n=1 Tax=Datura stramonium TaxID=4076 RepID=A0ABS8RUS9_DATST|nr:hypothetical protein [Datura stramonium]
MKKSGLLVASAAAAISSSVTTFNSSPKVRISLHKDDNLKKKDESCSNSVKASTSSSSDKFAPRFDGLRFIETLITAHR